MNKYQQRFASALRLYVSNSLLNDKGWPPLQAIAENTLATVEIGMVGQRFHIAAIECADVTSLEKELKQAQKTIKQLESQIEALTPTPKETVVTEETPEVTEEPTRTTRKRKP